MRHLNWLLPLATMATYAVLVGYLVPQLAGQSGGALPFDFRPFGYSLAQAQVYLAALTPAGAKLYLGAVRLADTIGPILLTLSLILPLRGRGQFWFLPALAFGLLDLSENVAITRLIHLGPDVDGPAVALAASFTEAKFAAVALAFGLALYGSWAAWRDR